MVNTTDSKNNIFYLEDVQAGPRAQHESCR